MDWDINKTSLSCAGCEKAFEEEEAISSALFDENGQFMRRDYCIACWEKTDTGKAFGFWRTRIPRKDARVKRFVDDETLMDFFRRLERQQDLSKRNFHYVLSLLLMRKKLLKFRDVKKTEGGEELVLYSRADDREYRVYNPQLTEEEIQQVRDEIGQVLNVQL